MNNASFSNLKKPIPNFHWKCRHTWRRSAKNTAWCLLGCSIGDFGTILYFKLTGIPWATLSIMILAIFKEKFCLNKIIVSKIILVIIPLIIAKTMIAKTGKGIFVN